MYQPQTLSERLLAGELSPDRIRKLFRHLSSRRQYGAVLEEIADKKVRAKVKKLCDPLAVQKFGDG